MTSPVTTIDRETETPRLDFDGTPLQAHIVVTPDHDAAAKVLEARVTGTAITALCGRVFTPQRDPRNVPVCEMCKDIYTNIRSINAGLNNVESIRQ